MYNVRRAAERDIPAIMDLLVQVDMVHHNGRPDLFKGPATKYTEDDLRRVRVLDAVRLSLITPRQNKSDYGKNCNS